MVKKNVVEEGSKLKRGTLLMNRKKTSRIKKTPEELEEEQEAKRKKKPMLDYAKIFNSPEYQTVNFSQASNLQLHIWHQHTTPKEQTTLWFGRMTAYHRSKLWNRLVFSEDALLYICNSPEYTR
jgi:hypothetical protein